jgi:hypothetical protein
MATYKLNARAVANARKLIDARQYVLESDWGEAQPSPDDENRFLKAHSWDDYAAWHLGLTEGATDETKAVPRQMRTSSNPAPGQPFGNVENRRCTE